MNRSALILMLFILLPATGCVSVQDPDERGVSTSVTLSTRGIADSIFGVDIGVGFNAYERREQVHDDLRDPDGPDRRGLAAGKAETTSEDIRKDLSTRTTTLDGTESAGEGAKEIATATAEDMKNIAISAAKRAAELAAEGRHAEVEALLREAAEAEKHRGKQGAKDLALWGLSCALAGVAEWLRRKGKKSQTALLNVGRVIESVPDERARAEMKDMVKGLNLTHGIEVHVNRLLKEAGVS